MDSVIQRYILQIVETESPIHNEHVCKRIVEYQGTTLGSRIRAHLEWHIRALVKSNNIISNKDYLWWQEVKIESPRDFSFYPKKDIDFIAPEELERALFIVIKESISIDKLELITETARRLGFRATSGVQATLSIAIKKMIKNYQIEIADDLIRSK